MFKIDRDSYGTLAVVFAIVAVIMVLIYEFISIAWIKWPLLAFFWLFCIWQVYFFRVPEREAAGSSTVVSSAADGKVVIIDEFEENEYLHCKCRRVCVYMNFFDVHANFYPVSGEVSYYKYHPGEHFLAFKPKASEENEHATVCIRTEHGDEVLFRQLAGTFARRIVNHSKPGDKAEAGIQYGIIKFGSRMDIFLPLDAEIEVKIGDRVKACESVIARLPR